VILKMYMDPNKSYNPTWEEHNFLTTLAQESWRT
jgi:hypothetical protein